MNKGDKAYEKKNFVEASAYYAQAMELNSEDYRALKSFADSKHKLEDFKEAIKVYNQAQKLNAQDPVLYFDRGAAKLFVEDYSGAISDFDQSIMLDPNVAEVYFFRAYSKSELQDYIGAISDYNKAIELKPDYADAYYNRGAAKGELGNYETAMEDFNLALEKEPIENGYLNIALSYLGMKEYEKAIQGFTEVIEMRNVNLAKAYFYRGEAYFDTEQSEKACVDWERASNLEFEQADENISEYCGESPKKDRTKDIDIVF